MNTSIVSQFKKKAFTTAKAWASLSALLLLSPTIISTSAHAQSLGLSHKVIDIPNKTGIVLLKERADGTLEDAGETIGGKVWAGIGIEVPKGGSFAPGVQSVTLRVREEEDASLGIEPANQHPESENHIDTVLPFTPDPTKTEFKWQKRVGDGAWGNTQETFSATNISGEVVSYRVLFPWETSKIKESGSTKLYDHNGAHTVFPVAVNGQSSRAAGFVQLVSQNSPGAPASAKKTVQVKNLIITKVSISSGTSDYFRFSPDAPGGSPLKSPTFKFSIEDAIDLHKYRWKIAIRPTWHMYTPETSFPNTPYAYLEGVSDTPSDIEVVWNGGRHNNNLSTYDQADTDLYTFDLYVYEMDGTMTVDSAQMKSPYNLNIDNHYFQFNDNVEESKKLEVGYKLSDKKGIIPKDFYVDILDSGLNFVKTVPLPATLNQNVGPISVHDVADNEDVEGWRGVFLGVDGNAVLYRDHTPKKTLAYNQKVAPTRVVLYLENYEGGTNSIGHIDLEYIKGAFYDVARRRDRFGITLHILKTGWIDSNHNPTAALNAYSKRYEFIRNAVCYEGSDGTATFWPGFTEKNRDGHIGRARRIRINGVSLNEGKYGWLDNTNEVQTRSNIVLHETGHAFGIDGTGDERNEHAPKCIMYFRLNSDFANSFAGTYGGDHFGGLPSNPHAKNHMNEMRSFCGLSRY